MGGIRPGGPVCRRRGGSRTHRHSHPARCIPRCRPRVGRHHRGSRGWVRVAQRARRARGVRTCLQPDHRGGTTRVRRHPARLARSDDRGRRPRRRRRRTAVAGAQRRTRCADRRCARPARERHPPNGCQLRRHRRISHLSAHRHVRDRRARGAGHGPHDARRGPPDHGPAAGARTGPDAEDEHLGRRHEGIRRRSTRCRTATGCALCQCLRWVPDGRHHRCRQHRCRGHRRRARTGRRVCRLDRSGGLGSPRRSGLARRPARRSTRRRRRSGRWTGPARRPRRQLRLGRHAGRDDGASGCARAWPVVDRRRPHPRS